MTIESTTTQPAESLRGLCAGAIHLPGDPGYDEARVPWNVAIDQRPAAVAYPASAEEVAQVIFAVAAINTSNRLMITTRAEPGHYQPGMLAAA